VPGPPQPVVSCGKTGPPGRNQAIPPYHQRTRRAWLPVRREQK
jgi:hypothetical protein